METVASMTPSKDHHVKTSIDTATTGIWCEITSLDYIGCLVNREIHDRRRDKNFDNKSEYPHHPVSIHRDLIASVSDSGIKKQRPARKPGLTSGQTDKDSAPDFVRSSKFAVLECDHSEDEIQDTPPQSNSVTGEE